MSVLFNRFVIAEPPMYFRACHGTECLFLAINEELLGSAEPLLKSIGLLNIATDWNPTYRVQSFLSVGRQLRPSVWPMGRYMSLSSCPPLDENKIYKCCNV